MSDKELLELVAKTWLENGGDSEGFVWNMAKLLEEIRSQELKEK